MGRTKNPDRWEQRIRRSREHHRARIEAKISDIDAFREACRWLLAEAKYQSRRHPPAPGQASRVTQATNRIIRIIREMIREERQRRNEEGTT